jgi:signal transduction histidine kinase
MGYDQRRWRTMAALVAVYAAAMLFSLFLAGAKTGIATVWPSNAVLVAALMVLARRQAVAMLATATAIHVVLVVAVGDSLFFSLAVSGLDGIQAIAVAVLLRKLKITTRPRGMGDLIRLTLASVLATVALSIPTSMLAALIMGLPAHVGWSAWLTANVLGMALTLPTTLILLDHRQGWPRRSLVEHIALLGLIGMVSAAVFALDHPTLQVLAFPPVLLAAFRCGPRGAALGAMTVLAVSIPVTLWSVGADAAHRDPQLRQLLVFHVVLYVACLASAMTLARQARLQNLLVRRQAVARAARARAQAASQAKSEFLATMSHEIRTPLNSILGFADLLGATEPLTPEGRHKVDLVAGGRSVSLVTLVNDILDFSRLEAGRIKLNPAPRLAPPPFCAKTVEIVAPDAAGQGPGPRLSRPRHPLRQTTATFYALDESRLRQVLLNLLNNAVKFTPGRPDRRRAWRSRGEIGARRRHPALRDHRHRRRRLRPEHQSRLVPALLPRPTARSAAPSAARGWAWRSARPWSS